MVQQIQDIASKPKNSRLYEIVENHIFNDIQNGIFKPGESIGSVNDLAKKLDVSPATVQHSLQSLAAKGVVERKPRKGTFVSSNIDSTNDANGANTKNTISLLVPDIRYPEFASLARALQDLSHEKGMDVVVASTDNRVDRYVEILNRQVENGVYGIMLAPPFNGSISFDVISKIHKKEIPVVACYRQALLKSWPLVRCDDYNSGYIATKHLFETGKKNPGLVLSVQSVQDDLDVLQKDKILSKSLRHHGYLQALIDNSSRRIKDHSFAINLENNKWPYAFEEETLESVLTEHPEIDSFCCENDILAVMTMRVLKKLGKRIPEDVAVIGCGGYSNSLGYDNGQLSTLTGLYEGMAKEAFDLITAMKKGHQFSEDLEKPVKLQLKKGSSTVG